MAYGNVVNAPAGGVSVAASQTDAQVSRPFRPADNMQALVTVVCSAISETTGITFKLKDSADASTYSLVGDQSHAAVVKKAFACGTAEVTNVTLPAFAAAAQGDYLHATAQDGTLFAVWFDKDAAGTAPTGVLYVAADEQIEVDIVTGDTAAQVAAKFRAALVANAAWNLAFTTSAVSTATITLTQLNTGAVTDPAPKTENDGGAGSIVVSVTTPGSNGDVTLATNLIAETTHGFTTGEAVYLVGSDVPAGLTTATKYYLIATDANSYKLAETQALALAGTAIDITDYGSGTATIYRTQYEIRMIKEDATDLAQLPLNENVIVTATSGASDSCTVSAVYTRYTP